MIHSVFQPGNRGGRQKQKIVTRKELLHSLHEQIAAFSKYIQLPPLKTSSPFKTRPNLWLEFVEISCMTLCCFRGLDRTEDFDRLFPVDRCEVFQCESTLLQKPGPSRYAIQHRRLRISEKISSYYSDIFGTRNYFRPW